MPEILTESFCERCGTRYTFESAAPRKTRRIGKFKTLSKGMKNWVMSDDTSLDEAMAAARNDEERELTSHQLDAFHSTFNFCMTCRQYTCGNCWNTFEGRCLTCAPNLNQEILPAPFPGQAPLDPIRIETGSWPEVDLTVPGVAAEDIGNGNDHDALRPVDDIDPWAGVDSIDLDDIPDFDPAARLAFLSGETLAPAIEAETVPFAPASEPAPELASAGPELIEADAAPEPELVAEAAEPEPVEADAAPQPELVADAAEPESELVADAVEPESELVADAVEPESELVADAVEPESELVADAVEPESELVADAVEPESIEADAAPEPELVADAAEPEPELVAVEPESELAAAGPESIEADAAPEPELVAEAAEPESKLAAGAVTELPPNVEGRARAGSAKTSDLLRRFRPGQNIDAELAAYEEGLHAAAEPQPEPVAAAEPEVVAEPEPVAAAEPEVVAEPEPVAAAEPEVVAEPEPVAAAEPEVVAEPQPEPPQAAEPAREDRIEQPTWQIFAPDQTPATGPAGQPRPPTPRPAPLSASSEPQWPTRPDIVDSPAMTLLANRGGGTSSDGLWAASAQEVLAAPVVLPVAGAPTGVQPCANCGLSLSATARFCRRCGSRQG